MKKSKPRIGVTKPFKGGLSQNIAVSLMVRVCGGSPLSLTPSSKTSSELLADLDGLIVTGGTDVNPELYQSQKIKQDYIYDNKRDEFESRLIKKATDKGLPIFCICRGAQLLNVVIGGSLYEDISEVFENSNYPSSLLGKIFFRKKINISEETILKEVIKENSLMVNSLHSQSIKDLGEGLVVSAIEENGIVQAIECGRTSKSFIMGVQFHPEFLFYRREIRSLIKKFISECRAH